MTERETHIALLEELARREAATPEIGTGIPGVCIAILAAPNCIVVAHNVGIPYVYALN